MFRHTSSPKRYSPYQMNKEFAAIRNIENRIARFWGVLKYFSDMHPHNQSLLMDFKTYDTVITKINTAIDQYNHKLEFHTFIDQLMLIAKDAIQDDDECKYDPNITELIRHTDTTKTATKSKIDSDYLLYKNLMVTIASLYLKNHTAAGAEVCSLTSTGVILRCQPLLSQLEVFAFRFLESGECALNPEDLRTQVKLGFIRSDNGETASFVDEALLSYFAARYVVACLQANLAATVTKEIPYQQEWVSQQSIRAYVSAHSTDQAHSLVWPQVKSMLRTSGDDGELGIYFQLWLDHPTCSNEEIDEIFIDLTIKNLTDRSQTLQTRRAELRKLKAAADGSTEQVREAQNPVRFVR